VKLPDELSLYGATVDADAFNRMLLEIHQSMCPQWNAEQLLYHPTTNLVFVRAVQARAGEGLPEEMILRRLNNLRKRGPIDETDD
jgi:hypothetical protein